MASCFRAKPTGGVRGPRRCCSPPPRGDHVEKTILPAIGSRPVGDLRSLCRSEPRLSEREPTSWPTPTYWRSIETGSRGLLPDRTLLLAMPGEQAELRARMRDGGEIRSDRWTRGELSRAKSAPLSPALQSEEPDRFRKIDASGSPQEVTARLLAALDDWLP